MYTWCKKYANRNHAQGLIQKTLRNNDITYFGNRLCLAVDRISNVSFHTQSLLFSLTHCYTYT